MRRQTHSIKPKQSAQVATPASASWEERTSNDRGAKASVSLTELQDATGKLASCRMELDSCGPEARFCRARKSRRSAGACWLCTPGSGRVTAANPAGRRPRLQHASAT